MNTPITDANAVKVTDRTDNPSPTAKRILREVWGGGSTLTTRQHDTLLAEAGLTGTPPEEQPSALTMALALSGLLAKWEAEGQPRQMVRFC